MHRLTLLSPTGVPHNPNNMVSSREVLDGQVTGEGRSKVADSSWLVALEQKQLWRKGVCSGVGYSRICGRRVGVPSSWARCMVVLVLPFRIN